MSGLRRIALVVIIAGSCGDDGAVALDQAPRAYAEAYCARLFACCEVAEVAEVLRGFDPPSDEPACIELVTRVFGNEFVDDMRKADAAGHARYDGVAMQACMTELEATSCPDLARVFRFMTFPTTCRLVRIPLAASGASCDHDFQCTTSYCAGGGETTLGSCAELPRIGEACPDSRCVDGSFCDRSLDAAGRCAPLRSDGMPCSSALACESFSCNGGTCGPVASCDGT